jgi:hypothetical protein
MKLQVFLNNLINDSNKNKLNTKDSLQNMINIINNQDNSVNMSKNGFALSLGENDFKEEFKQ